MTGLGNGGRGLPPQPRPPDPDDTLTARIYTTNNRTLPDKKTLLKILSAHIHVNRITQYEDCYRIIYMTKDGKDITNNALKNSLNKMNLTARTKTKNTTTERTLLVRQVDDHIIEDHTPEEIKEEIETNNNIKIEKIITFENRTRFFLIITQDTTSADTLQEKGFQAFNLSVNKKQISRKTFVPLKFCTNCFKHDDHLTKDCKVTQTICSQCSQTGHTYKECKATQKQCANCKGNHPTFYRGCPTRKTILAHKQEEARTQEQTQTYSAEKTL